MLYIVQVGNMYVEDYTLAFGIPRSVTLTSLLDDAKKNTYFRISFGISC